MPEKNFLILDLDGTLIKSNIFFETFWAAFSKDLLVPFKAIIKLSIGKAYLKKYLGDSSDINVKKLPYRNSVIEYIKIHRSQGGKVALVTSSNEDIANKISEYLNLFDEVHGSSQYKNLNDIKKADFQNKKYGFKNYDYIGNSYSDKYLWKDSNLAINVGSNIFIKKICEKSNPNCFNLNEDSNNFLISFLEEIRIYQWTKNLLVFIPLLASHQLETFYFINGIIAFFAFSFVASGVYLINDLLDLESDRLNPNKCKRPLASGLISLSFGTYVSLLFFVIGGLLGIQLGISFLQILLFYCFITISYSLYIKRKAIIDIFILAGIYTLRIIGGGIATNLDISFWLLGFSIFIFLSLASVKRQSELVDLRSRGKVKIIGRDYQINDLNFISQLSLGSGLISTLIIALYINSPKVMSLYNYPEYLWLSCCFFLFWIVRICYKTNKGEMHFDPIIFAIKDKLSLFIMTIIVLFTFLAK